MPLELYFFPLEGKPVSGEVKEAVLEYLRSKGDVNRIESRGKGIYMYENSNTGVTFEVHLFNSMVEHGSPAPHGDGGIRGALSGLQPFMGFFLDYGRPPWYGWEIRVILKVIFNTYPFKVYLTNISGIISEQFQEVGPYYSEEEIFQLWTTLNRLAWLALAEAGQFYEKLVFIEDERLFPVWSWYFHHPSYLSVVSKIKKDVYHELPRLSVHLPSRQVVIIGGLPLNKNTILPDAVEAFVLGYERRWLLFWKRWRIITCCPRSVLPESVRKHIIEIEDHIPAKLYQAPRRIRVESEVSIPPCFQLDEMKSVDPSFVVDFEFTEEERRQAREILRHFLENHRRQS